MEQLPKGSYLQGSCCTPMNRRHYQAQITGLKACATIAEICADPYNVLASLVITLLHADHSIALTPAQQAVYTQAASMTNDHGWCQCWAWYAHSGQAKDLIRDGHFSAAQVVAVMNLEDCCGGA